VACAARVGAVRALSAEILEVDLAMTDPPELDFEAGQWISLPFGPKTVRAYSIASTPRSPRRITLCIDVAPGGLGSAWVRGLTPGQGVEFKAPFGGFVFRRDDPRRPLFVAEEIGIVPIRSMLLDLDESGVELRGTLVYRGRDRTWRPYDDELAALSRRRPGFAYVPLIAPEGAGEVTRAVDAAVIDPRDLVAYVCGGGPMVDAVRAALMARGLDRRSVRWEKFW
jgi:ferredoxin-NADP reductase